MEWTVVASRAVKDYLKKSNAYRGIGARLTDDLIQVIIKSIMTQLMTQKRVEIRKFGSFRLTTYNSSPPVYKVHFKAFHDLNDKVKKRD